MKSPDYKVYVISLIALIILIGSNPPDFFKKIESLDNQYPSQSEYSFAHGSLMIPPIHDTDYGCDKGTPVPDSLCVPAAPNFYLQDYETKLYTFILNRDYAQMGWCEDAKVRDTGPWIKGVSYGIHPAVKIYYSPRMMYWLTGKKRYWSGAKKNKNPRSGEVPPGAMIIKEMFAPPAEIYTQLDSLFSNSEDPDCNNEAAYDSLLNTLVSGWAIMVKASDDSKDDWFWGSVSPQLKDESISAAVRRQLDDYSHVLYSGFGVVCLRCHASAEKEYTFSDENNISGKGILEFRDDNSWRNQGHMLGTEKDPAKWDGPLVKILENDCINDSLVRQLFLLPQELLPWTDQNIPDWKDYMEAHMPPVDPSKDEVQSDRLASVNPDFVATYPEINPAKSKKFRSFPDQWADHVIPGPDGPEQYITSDNCYGCHGGLGGDPYDIAMFIKTGPNYGDGFNVSEYGEWRWSPMGLAGRDPIFYAQLESEMVLLEQDAKTGGLLHGSLTDNKQQVTNTCLSCHGSMGQRQLMLDAKNKKYKNQKLDPNFNVEYMYLYEALSADDTIINNELYKYHKYGALAREGISCTTCHHIDPPDPSEVANWKTGKDWLTAESDTTEAYLLFNNTTGQYNYGPANVINGPFEKVKTYPMKNQMGITPKYNEFITQSEMCGSCHSINLPNIGLKVDKFPILNAAEKNKTLKSYNHTIEQATYLEWKNSAYSIEGSGYKSCQGCHMPGGFKSLDGNIDIPQLTTKIASIQDNTYPDVAGLAGPDSVNITLRPDYKRHEHVGLNVFLLEMFDQFPDILGVTKDDYMTSATTGNALAIENMIKQAREETVKMEIEVSNTSDDSIDVVLSINNLTGHRFPSGVAFRRAFIELLVQDGSEIIWGSGRTNSVGVIVDENGQPLKTEFLPNSSSYQPHYQLIRDQRSVQIYEELNMDVDSQFTTSFIHRVHPIKDNRILPRGHRHSSVYDGDGDVIYQFMQATDPEGESIEGDTCYVKKEENKERLFDGKDIISYRIPFPKGGLSNNLIVKATMYSQAIPPYWLHQRFTLAPDGEATKRLYYLTSNLNLENTAMKDWKLPLVSEGMSYNQPAKKWKQVKMKE